MAPGKPSGFCAALEAAVVREGRWCPLERPNLKAVKRAANNKTLKKKCKVYNGWLIDLLSVYTAGC